MSSQIYLGTDGDRVKLHRLLPSDRPEPAAMISRAGRGSGAHASRGGRGAGKPPGSLTEVTLPGVTLNPLGLGLVVGRSLKGVARPLAPASPRPRPTGARATTPTGATTRGESTAGTPHATRPASPTQRSFQTSKRVYGRSRSPSPVPTARTQPRVVPNPRPNRHTSATSAWGTAPTVAAPTPPSASSGSAAEMTTRPSVAPSVSPFRATAMSPDVRPRPNHVVVPARTTGRASTVTSVRPVTGARAGLVVRESTRASAGTPEKTPERTTSMDVNCDERTRPVPFVVAVARRFHRPSRPRPQRVALPGRRRRQGCRGGRREGQIRAGGRRG